MRYAQGFLLVFSITSTTSLAELGELRTASELEAQTLRDTLEQFAEASGSELTYREGEIVYSDLIAAGTVPAISAALQAFVAGAREAATGRGASDVELSAEDLASLEQAVPRGAVTGERYPDMSSIDS